MSSVYVNKKKGGRNLTLQVPEKMLNDVARRAQLLRMTIQEYIRICIDARISSTDTIDLEMRLTNIETELRLIRNTLDELAHGKKEWVSLKTPKKNPF